MGRRYWLFGPFHSSKIAPYIAITSLLDGLFSCCNIETHCDKGNEDMQLRFLTFHCELRAWRNVIGFLDPSQQTKLPPKPP